MASQDRVSRRVDDVVIDATYIAQKLQVQGAHIGHMLRSALETLQMALGGRGFQGAEIVFPDNQIASRPSIARYQQCRRLA